MTTKSETIVADLAAKARMYSNSIRASEAMLKCNKEGLEGAENRLFIHIQGVLVELAKINDYLKKFLDWKSMYHPKEAGPFEKSIVKRFNINENYVRNVDYLPAVFSYAVLYENCTMGLTPDDKLAPRVYEYLKPVLHELGEGLGLNIEEPEYRNGPYVLSIKRK